MAQSAGAAEYTDCVSLKSDILNKKQKNTKNVGTASTLWNKTNLTKSVEFQDEAHIKEEYFWFYSVSLCKASNIST